ncbi:aminopeptidase P family protein [Sulfitobacter donghicola]|uniref:X-Pro aminopeptidase n=1 Tax=Sulfitobacter donghicola DSW-25 = KCTC 12864 = JCM 14565 TaxID=1300350 RepID=A0A073IHV3_9RHOB|nr:aminopeptidase P family protein [Sulfitobacter donghicola]KEJ89369.1 X-Pro aminopeptidase [Sulfitobacter donghicola DSW-25 = KCTC 12864 = JCM 14565]KIN69183.1 Metallopeptidase, family M24 [Sulfitobacter donghicola DSW-25 = KCTC 12864 = JCM 14565]
MYQTFEVTARPEQGPPRLEALRALFSAEQLNGFIIPRADAHQGEYVSDRDARLAWLTGFTGSAGFCVALEEIAGVFIDGRYRTQVKSQVADVYTPVPWPETSMAAWLREQLPNGGRVGFDPWLHTVDQIKQAQETLADSGIELVQCRNLVDAIWHDQPAPPMEPAKIHPLEFAGESHSDKRSRLAKTLVDAGEAAAIITLPDSICWLLNIRGADIERNPVVHGFAVLHADGSVDLFSEPSKYKGLQDHLGSDVRLHAPDRFLATLSELTGPVRLDTSTAPQIVADALGDAMVRGAEPCALPKACKNEAEIEGAAQAHLRDGAAMVEMLCWLDEQPPASITETQVVSQLETLRRRDNGLQDISFETIAGTGPNGAIMHYRVTEETDTTLEDGHLIVLDSGGQYLDGTTDITRTIAIGTPPQEAREAFTRVLAGMIAMSRLRWPKGLAGAHIEAIGRMPLWLAGQDFDHGLGHGVGAYLSVHEGPQRLSRVSQVPLEQGMILSNEPGYYREGAFGIRIENLLVVQNAAPLAGGDAHREMLDWRTLAFAPIDRRLIIPEMLDPAAREWLNEYHAQVANKIGPRVSAKAKEWLSAATAPI